jgi:nucleoside-diphosphate-sugar epimerase
VHVDDVAAGVVAALNMLDQPNMGGAHVFNLVEDPAPARSELVAALNEAGPVRKLLKLPWQAHLSMARGVSALFRSLTGGVSGLPGLLSPSALWARHAPVHYDIALARNVLGWRPRYQAVRDVRARALAFTGSKI